MKYQTLAALRDACALARAAKAEKLPYLVIGNDGTRCYQDGDCVFRMPPAELLEQALDLLGIPHGEAQP